IKEVVHRARKFARLDPVEYGVEVRFELGIDAGDAAGADPVEVSEQMVRVFVLADLSEGLARKSICRAVVTGVQCGEFGTVSSLQVARIVLETNLPRLAGQNAFAGSPGCFRRRLRVAVHNEIVR